MTNLTPEGEALWKASGMTPDEQEGLSKVHGAHAVVVPLKTGNYAVFANDRTRESMVIVDEFGLAIAVLNRANRPVRKAPTAPSNSVPAYTGPIDASDFGL